MSEDFQIRRVGEDEFAAVLKVAGVAFGEEYPEDDVEALRAGFPFDRSLAAFEHGTMVATSAVYSQELTLPGGTTLPMGGLTWIATLPTHRRRGLLGRLVSAQSADMAERGEALSGLGASEATIYGRYGYGPATTVMSFSVDRADGAFVPPPTAEDAERFVLLDSEEAASRLPAIYEDLRRRQPGAVSRPPMFWESYLADPAVERGGATQMLHVAHETHRGTPDGYVSYRVKGEWQGATALNNIRVVELMASNTAVYRALWRFVLDTDLCHTVSCERARVDEPLRWLLADPRGFKVGALFDFLWLRLLDVPRALAARRYAAAGRLALEISDPFPKPVTERYLLQAEPATPGGPPAPPELDPVFPAVASCGLTALAPDLALGIDVLAAAYLGGVSFSVLAAAGRVRELTPGAAARADALFYSGTAPFCATEF